MMLMAGKSGTSEYDRAAGQRKQGIKKIQGAFSERREGSNFHEIRRTFSFKNLRRQEFDFYRTSTKFRDLSNLLQRF